MSHSRMLGFAATAVVFLLLHSSISLSAEPARFSVVVKARKVEESQRTVRVVQGTSVEIDFTADEPMELHLHGYDRLLSVRPDKVAVLKLDARIAGRFAVEAHHLAGEGRTRSRKNLVLLYLEVHPAP